MTYDLEELQRVIAQMAVLIDSNDDPDPQLYALFFQQPEYAFQLIELINNLDEEIVHEGLPIYSACIFAFDICIAQLQAATEAHNKLVAKSLIQLMERLATLIKTGKHTLGYWLPILNAFYEVHVELTQSLKDAYFELASEEDDGIDYDSDVSHLDSIRDLIRELSDLSIFDITENFFAQSYAMPPEFFSDLVYDLCSIEEGRDIAILALLHPNAQVRDIVVSTLDQLIDQINITSTSLSRLQVIKSWYHEQYHATFERWIKGQRKKGVIFDAEPQIPKVSIKATEVDGSGSQGVFIHIRKNRKNRLSGLLFKYAIGIKDTWVTPVIPLAEVTDYYHQAFEESVTLRDVDQDYFQLLTEHFLADSIAKGDVPHLHFLEMQELLGLRFKPNKIDFNDLFEHMSIQITPFTPDMIEQSLKRSKLWLKNKQFTESWYLESAVVDKIVNHNSNFIDGVKVCRFEDAIAAVFDQEMESTREKWQFHFLWMALWLKAKAKKNENAWQESFFIAYVIREGRPLKEIPVMQEICKQTVINSVETMHERKTHLSKE